MYALLESDIKIYIVFCVISAWVKPAVWWVLGKCEKWDVTLPFFFFFGNIYWRTHPTWRLYLDSFAASPRNTVHPRAGRELRPLCVFVQYCTKSLSGSSHLMRPALFSFCFVIYTQFGFAMIIFPWEVCKTVWYLRRILLKKLISAHSPHP